MIKLPLAHASLFGYYEGVPASLVPSTSRTPDFSKLGAN